jgi:hypothetical protein
MWGAPGFFLRTPASGLNQMIVQGGYAMKKTVLALATFLFFTAGTLAQSQRTADEEFSWHAGLVALDERARIVTVKAPIVSDRVRADFEGVKPGERILVRWSGFHDYADSVAEARRSMDVRNAEERFTFPVEFVSFDPVQRFVTFKVPVPETSIANLKALKPTDWVTVTSPHGPSSKTAPITAIRPYGPRASTNAS